MTINIPQWLIAALVIYACFELLEKSADNNDNSSYKPKEAEINAFLELFPPGTFTRAEVQQLLFCNSIELELPSRIWRSGK